MWYLCTDLQIFLFLRTQTKEYVMYYDFIFYAIFHIMCGIVSTGISFAVFQRSPSIERGQFLLSKIGCTTISFVAGPAALASFLVLLVPFREKLRGFLWPWSQKADREADVFYNFLSRTFLKPVKA